MLRRLYLRDGEQAPIAVDVSLSLPVEVKGSWFCRYRIGWPEGSVADEIGGSDAIQAVYAAMQAVALSLYASEHHKSGNLYWYELGEGYGFPMPKVGRSDLVGEDKASQG
jgi:hypothetical protein